MSLPEDGFDAACQAIIGSQFEQPSFKSVVRPNPELMRRLVNLQKSVCSIAKTMPELFELPEVVRAFEQNSIHLMVRCLTEGTISTMSSCDQRHEASALQHLRICAHSSSRFERQDPSHV